MNDGHELTSELPSEKAMDRLAEAQNGLRPWLTDEESSELDAIWERLNGLLEAK